MRKRNDIMMALDRIIITLPGGIFFVVVMPFIIFRLSLKIGPLYKYKIIIGDLNYFFGGTMIIIGLVLAIWTVYIQIERGLGTPIPMIPPKKLLMNGPYRYCRNPMAFGIYIFYFGICFFLGTLSTFSIVILFIIILSLYIKIGEEPDLEKRFGQAYREYKSHTPFIIPKIFGKRWYFLFLH